MTIKTTSITLKFNDKVFPSYLYRIPKASTKVGDVVHENSINEIIICHKCTKMCWCPARSIAIKSSRVGGSEVSMGKTSTGGGDGDDDEVREAGKKARSRWEETTHTDSKMMSVTRHTLYVARGRRAQSISQRFGGEYVNIEALLHRDREQFNYRALRNRKIINTLLTSQKSVANLASRRRARLQYLLTYSWS